MLAARRIVVYGAVLRGVECRPVACVYSARAGSGRVAVAEALRRALLWSGDGLPVRAGSADPALDLPVALCALAASGRIPPEALEGTAAVGRLAPDGSVLPVRGAFSAALDLGALGFRRLLVPEANAPEAAAAGTLEVFPVRHILGALFFLRGDAPLSPFRGDAPRPSGPDMADVRGHAYVKRALEVAAAGGHDILLVGPSGVGKTWLARAMASILPPPSPAEAVEANRLWSAEGLGLPPGRPFRVLGPGATPRQAAAEARRARHGVLLVDDLPAVPRRTLEVLFAEDARENVRIVATARSCPCGAYGAVARSCSCSAARIRRYRQAWAPAAERFAIRVEVPDGADASDPGSEPSDRIRERVARALDVQRRRGVPCNARMTPDLIDRFCPLGPDARRLMEAAVRQWGLSLRAVHDRLRVARTIADLDGSETIETRHLVEALGYGRTDP
jgi:magnesium chelatase family protein